MDLATFTAELASVFRSAIERAGLRLVVDCPSLPEPIYVDRQTWEKIVLNLLSNAFKFTLTGEIRVCLYHKGNQVELTVQDTGIGIPAAEIPRLFERFHQVKGARGQTFEGSGIGLSLVQELVKLHGGTVQVSSVEGKGSCFQVSIPTGSTHLPQGQIEAASVLTSTAIAATTYLEEALRWLSEESAAVQALNSNVQAPSPKVQALNSDIQALNSDIQALNSEVQRPTAELQAQTLEVQPQNSKLQASSTEVQAPNSNVGPQSANMQSALSNLQATNDKTARVLLVDDNADMCDYLQRLLSQHWQVETAANGAIALSLIQQRPPDLVLSDVMMPELDGFQLLKALRDDPQTRGIPVILLSARAGEEATIEGLAAGADDYLIKPFSARELMARVETQLQMSRLRQEQSANRFKSQFLLTVTHALQAPLATILVWARLLQTQPFAPEKVARALATIERNAEVEAKLVQDLLDISSILSGNLGVAELWYELAP
jgi:signal transduction histidine kinase